MKKSTILILAIAVIIVAGFAYFASGSNLLGLAIPQKTSSEEAIPRWCIESCPEGKYSSGVYKDGKLICDNQKNYQIYPVSYFLKNKDNIQEADKLISEKLLPPNQSFNKKEKQKNIEWGYCDCNQKTFTSPKTGKTYNCPEKNGDSKTYKEIGREQTEVYLYKAPASYCEEKWQCPSGYEINWYMMNEKCNTWNSEKAKKIAQCENKEPPEDLTYVSNPAYKEMCQAFMPDVVYNEHKIKEEYESLECVSQEKCMEYAQKTKTGEINTGTKAVGGKNVSSMKSSCASLYGIPFTPEPPPVPAFKKK